MRNDPIDLWSWCATGNHLAHFLVAREMNLKDYTEQQILQMEAGPEVDVLIATEVMGWTESSPRVGQVAVWLDADGKPQCQFRFWYPSGSIDQAYWAEDQVPEDQRDQYADILRWSVRTLGIGHWQNIHATPLQRCKALLIWKKRSLE